MRSTIFLTLTLMAFLSVLPQHVWAKRNSIPDHLKPNTLIESRVVSNHEVASVSQSPVGEVYVLHLHASPDQRAAELCRIMGKKRFEEYMAWRAQFHVSHVTPGKNFCKFRQKKPVKIAFIR